MKKQFSLPFVVMAMMFAVFLILANLMEVKVVKIGILTATAGLSVFPISYIINDCIVEVYGFAKARFVIWMGFLLNMIFVVFLQVCIALPSDPSWTAQAAVEQVFGNTPRILLGSFVAFIVGSMVNAQVMSRMKVRDGGKRFSLRAIMSTVFGESADSLIFFPIAFAGMLPLATIVTLVWTQVMLKTLYEIIALPITIRVVKLLKRVEGADVTDVNVDYKWWKVFKI
ncbi:MAG: queuosine precursor transporter [Muribaculaceae bacterium]